MRHPTAIISEAARIAKDVEIGPHVVIEGPVKIGAGTKIWPGAFITGDTSIGRKNQIGPNAVLGHLPQSMGFDPSVESRVVIGDNNIIRENVTIHRPITPNAATEVGNGCFLMAGSHVAHDSIIGNNVVLTNGAFIAGHVEIGDNAIISSPVGIHQFCRVGRLTMVGGMSRISMDAPPFMVVQGDNEIRSLNLIGLRRASISKESIAELKECFQIIFREDNRLDDALKAISKRFESTEAHQLADFVRASTRGICRPSK